MPQRTAYTRDLNSWLYSKNSHMPGAYLAPMQLPNIRGFALPGTINATSWTIPNMVGDPADCFAAEESIGVDISTSWPGVTYAAGYVGRSLGGWSGTSLTACAWLWIDTLADFGELLGSWDTRDGANFRYMVVDTDVGGAVRYRVSSDGTAANARTATTATGLFEAGRWNWVGMRFIPDVSFSLILNGVIYSNTTTPLSIYYTSPETAGATNTLCVSNDSAEGHYAKIFPGRRVSQVWCCTCGLPDYVIMWLWGLQAPVYGRT